MTAHFSPKQALTQALRTACPELLGDRTWLHLLQPLCSSPPPDAAADGVLAAVARRPALAGCAAVWAAALGRRALAVELQAMAPTEPRPAVLRSMEETGNVEQFFEDVLEGRCLACNSDLVGSSGRSDCLHDGPPCSTAEA